MVQMEGSMCSVYTCMRRVAIVGGYLALKVLRHITQPIEHEQWQWIGEADRLWLGRHVTKNGLHARQRAEARA